MGGMSENAHNPTIHRHNAESDSRYGSCRCIVEHTERKKVKQQDGRSVNDGEPGVNSPRGLAKGCQNDAICVVSTRKFHVVRKFIGWEALQDQLTGISVRSPV